MANIRERSTLGDLEAYQLGRFSFNSELLLFEILNVKEQISMCSPGLECRRQVRRWRQHTLNVIFMTAVLEAMRLDSGSKLRHADEIVWMISCAETSQDRRRLEGVVLCRCCVVLGIERDGARLDAHSGKGQNGQCVRVTKLKVRHGRHQGLTKLSASSSSHPLSSRTINAHAIHCMTFPSQGQSAIICTQFFYDRRQRLLLSCWNSTFADNGIKMRGEHPQPRLCRSVLHWQLRTVGFQQTEDMDEACDIKAAMRCLIPRLEHFEAIPMSVTGIPGPLTSRQAGSPGADHLHQAVRLRSLSFR